MPLYMNASDAMVLTSASEGSPNVVKEALACNLPVIAVAVGDVPQLLANIDGCRVCRRDAQKDAAVLLEQLGRQCHECKSFLARQGSGPAERGKTSSAPLRDHDSRLRFRRTTYRPNHVAYEQQPGLFAYLSSHWRRDWKQEI